MIGRNELRADRSGARNLPSPFGETYRGLVRIHGSWEIKPLVA
jgi:hypothetical protein